VLFMDERVRPVSDLVASVASSSGLPEELQRSLAKKQSDTSRFREAMAHSVETSVSASIAIAPARRDASSQ
jgi:hypothetical protein